MAQDGAHLTKRLERRVGDFLDEHGLAEAGSPIVAGVSGGPDSVCLLHLLARLRARLPLDLRAAHLHHGLRGAEADDDAAYVAELCKRLDVPLATERIAVKKQRGRSLEEAAREARYAFFRRVATAARAHVLALGHTADDQAETILLNMLRGAGLAGLRGMRALARRNDGGVDLVIARPLLATRRQETEAYCREHGLEAREDSSNRSPEFTRNRVRQELVPLLESFNPKVQEALLRTGAQAEAGLDFLDAAARKAWPELVGVAEGRVTFDRARLNALHPALQAALMRRALLEARGTLQGIEEAHVAAMLALARGPSGKAVDLPDGLVLRAEYDALVLGPAGLGEAPAKLDGSWPLAVPGTTQVPGWRVQCRVVDVDPEAEMPSGQAALLDQALAQRGLVMRGRRPGDRFQPLGMTQPKKLQDFFVNERAPRHLRGAVPLVCAGGEIVWVVGYRVGETAKVPPGAARALRIEFARA